MARPGLEDRALESPKLWSARRRVPGAGAPEKRVYITLIPAPTGAADGWYRGRITLRNGEQYEARDYVINEVMSLPTAMEPAQESQGVALAPSFRRAEVPGGEVLQAVHL